MVEIADTLALITTVEENGLATHDGNCPNRCAECATSREALTELRTRIAYLAAEITSRDTLINALKARLSDNGIEP